MFEQLTAFGIFFLNGLTFEFGDDLLCWARHGLGGSAFKACQAGMVQWADRLAGAHAYSAFAGTIIGYAISPLSGLMSAMVGRPKTPGEAFGRGLVLELIEGVLSVIGQLVSGLPFAPALWSLGLGAVFGVLRGAVAAITHNSPAGAALRFVILLAVIAGLSIILGNLGLWPV